VIELDRLPVGAWSTPEVKRNRKAAAAAFRASLDANGKASYSLVGRTIFIRTKGKTYEFSVDDLIYELLALDSLLGEDTP
jgi:hypothetical protein